MNLIKRNLMTVAFTIGYALVTNGVAATPEDSAWEKIDAFKLDALKSYIMDYPGSSHVKSAKALIVMQTRLAAYRDKQEKPQFVITEQQMGQRWIDSKKSNGEKDISGFAFAKASFDPGVGLAGFMPLWKGSGSMTQTASGPALPTRAGSILAVKTYGMNSKDAAKKMGEYDLIFGGYHFVTPDSKGKWPDLEGSVFFGVIDGLGLVHIYGAGKVIAPDGKETELIEVEK